MSRTRLKPLHDQVVVVTGASSGIGLATARKAAKAGARLFLISRDGDQLAQVAAELREGGAEAEHAQADVADRPALEAAFDAAVARFGRIDTVVSNAGAAIYGDALSTPRDEHERLFQTNYWGAVNACELGVARLREGGGALIVVGSLASDMAAPGMGVYVASKHAVKGYLDTVRLELNRDKVPVSVTLIKPSGISTGIDEHAAEHLEGESKIPPPLYAPEVVAAAILRAAVRPFREITVGGAGQAQIMFATHFPGLFARYAGLMTPVVHDPSKPETARDNLFAPGENGSEHSRREGAGKPFSVYTAATTHPGLAAAAALAAGLAVAGAIGVAGARRRRPASWVEARSRDLERLGRRLHR